MYNYIKPIILSLAMLVVSHCSNAQNILYVNASTGSDTNPGTSWTVAYQSLQKALAAANVSTASEVDIWVASGYYSPVLGLSPSTAAAVGKDTAFLFCRGNGIGRSLKVYGGFAGTESSLSERDGTDTTYLTAQAPSSTVITYHVGIIAGLAPLADSVVLDGFVISSVNTNYMAYVDKKYNGVYTSDTMGGAMVIVNDSTPQVAVRNCIIRNNKLNCILGNIHGAGIALVNSFLDLENCSFINNRVDDSFNISIYIPSGQVYGGALYAKNSNFHARNCNFSNNVAVALQTNQPALPYQVAQGGAVYLNNDTCTFSNCSFNNNSVKASITNSTGGAVYITNCSPVFSGCSFTENKSISGNAGPGEAGGAICGSAAGASFINCLFSGNETVSGRDGGYIYGAAYGGAMAWYNSSEVNISSCTFLRNKIHCGYYYSTALVIGFGGAIYSSNSNIHLSQSSFRQDSVCNTIVLSHEGSGGAIYMASGRLTSDSCTFDSCYSDQSGSSVSGNNAIISLNQTNFTNGIANDYGGAVYNTGSTANNLRVNGCLFLNCTSSYGGGAVYIANNSCPACTDSIVSSVFAQNAAYYGGAVSASNYNGLIASNTFYADTANGAGGAIYFSGNYNNDTAANNLFYKNYSVVGNVDTSMNATGVFHFVSNYFSYVNPQFLNSANLPGPDGVWHTADDGLQLTQCSTALNTGSNQYVSSSDNTDFANQPRIESGIVNRGAYESNAPGAIVGPSVLCAGTTVTLSDTTAGGAWYSSDTAVASVSAGGLLTAISQGTSTITYVYPCGRSTMLYVTVEAPAAAITGADSVCLGSSTLLANSITGGTWSSSGPGVIINSGTGLATGTALGTDTITYVVTNICGTTYAHAPFSVQRSSSPVVGSDSVCAGSTLLLTDSVAGGTWSTTDTTIATINSLGILHGAASGSITVSYTIANACGTSYAAIPVTVNVPASGILGDSAVCIGSTDTLVDSASGGVWSMAPGCASISLSGVVTGISAGSTIVTYDVTNACGTFHVSMPLHVDRLVAPIVGDSTMCIGSVDTLTDSVSGGTWSVVGSAAISASGIVTAVSVGSSVISYEVVNACGTSSVSLPIVVDRYIAPITGVFALCTGATAVLADSATGGTWISTNTTVATISTSGTLNALSADTTTLLYITNNACGRDTAVALVSVAEPAGPIVGRDTVCMGNTLVLTDNVFGGIWTSSNTAIATVVGGIVTPVSPGTTDISYAITNACGTTSNSLTVLVLSVDACNHLEVSNNNSGASIRVYPNPAAGTVYFEFPASKKVIINIMDASGRTIIQQTEYDKNKISIDVRQYAAGIYMYEIITSEQTYTGKLLLEK